MSTIGISEITTYIPPGRLEVRPERYGMTPEFLAQVVGTQFVSRVDPEMSAVDCGLEVFSRLSPEMQNQMRQECDLVIVVGQTLDTNMPHTSAILHGRLGLPANCVCFDVSLGCTGFVHGLAIARAFLRDQGLNRALLFNVELMSRIVNPDDRATAPIFGDAVTLTVLSPDGMLRLKDFSFGTAGDRAPALRCEKGRLYMDGQAVYEFVCRQVPGAVKKLLVRNELQVSDVDQFLFHQASRRTVEKLMQTLDIETSRAPFDIHDHGNLGACSIPVLLRNSLESGTNRILACGFGVGLAWAAAILEREPK